MTHDLLGACSTDPEPVTCAEGDGHGLGAEGPVGSTDTGSGMAEWSRVWWMGVAPPFEPTPRHTHFG
ncbi:MAG: hypothetical protein QGG40_03745 [Myxococcota bacterium]|jgi:hypothetical protein|nr:hypothetical protein [Myxococcota bacterium]